MEKIMLADYFLTVLSPMSLLFKVTLLMQS